MKKNDKDKWEKPARDDAILQKKPFLPFPSTIHQKKKNKKKKMLRVAILARCAPRPARSSQSAPPLATHFSRASSPQDVFSSVRKHETRYRSNAASDAIILAATLPASYGKVTNSFSSSDGGASAPEARQFIGRFVSENFFADFRAVSAADSRRLNAAGRVVGGALLPGQVRFAEIEQILDANNLAAVGDIFRFEGAMAEGEVVLFEDEVEILGGGGFE
jgi:hypothetical protein